MPGQIQDARDPEEWREAADDLWSRAMSTVEESPEPDFTLSAEHQRRLEEMTNDLRRSRTMSAMTAGSGNSWIDNTTFTHWVPPPITMEEFERGINSSSSSRRTEPMTPTKAKTIKKERHLTKSERTALHHPPKDKYKLVDLVCDDLV